MHSVNCVCLFCVCLGVAAVAATAAEEVLQPNPVECLRRPAATDFGPPEGCNEQPQPHPRSVFMTVAATSSVAAVNTMFVIDLEHYQLEAPPSAVPGVLGPHPLTMPSTTWQRVPNERGEYLRFRVGDPVPNEPARVGYFDVGRIVRG